MVERVTIDLSERQAEVIEWLMGSPIMARWEDAPVEGMGEDFRQHLEKPELDRGEQTFTFPTHPDMMYVLTAEEGDLQRYVEMAEMSATCSEAEARGCQQVVNNLVEKVQEAGGADG